MQAQDDSRELEPTLVLESRTWGWGGWKVYEQSQLLWLSLCTHIQGPDPKDLPMGLFGLPGQSLA